MHISIIAVLQRWAKKLSTALTVDGVDKNREAMIKLDCPGSFL